MSSCPITLLHSSFLILDPRCSCSSRRALSTPHRRELVGAYAISVRHVASHASVPARLKRSRAPYAISIRHRLHYALSPYAIPIRYPHTLSPYAITIRSPYAITIRYHHTLSQYLERGPVSLLQAYASLVPDSA
eukprot:1890919-Rhodomonas_salina.1